MDKKTTAKHRLIYDHIHTQILSGEYGVGVQIPTEAELSRRFGASRVTVARALRDLELQGYLLRRRGAGSFVKQRRIGTGDLLALITPDQPGAYSCIVDEMAHAAHVRGYGLLLGKCPVTVRLLDDLIRRTQALCDQFIARKVAGVFFKPLQLPPERADVNRDVVRAFQQSGIAVVLLDRDLEDFPNRSGFDLVGIDHAQVGLLLTQHLCGLGYRRMEFISHDLAGPALEARFARYRHVLEAHGIAFDPQWRHEIDPDEPDLVRPLVADGPGKAFICDTDRVAAHLIRSLAALRVRVPEDVAVVGADDEDMSGCLSVTLTTVRHPCSQIGGAAVRTMIERLSEPRRPAREVRLSSKLIVRESCGAALRTTGLRSDETRAAEAAIPASTDMAEVNRRDRCGAAG